MFLNKFKLNKYMKLSELELWCIVLNAPKSNKTHKEKMNLLYSLEALNRKKESQV